MAKDKRMVFLTDIDDTLVDRKKQLSNENRQAIETFLEEGNIFAISTGRTAMAASRVVRELGIYGQKNVFISCYDGGMLIDTESGEVLSKSTIPLPVVYRFFDLAREFGIHLQTYQGDDVLSEDDDENLNQYCTVLKLPKRVVTDLRKELTEEPSKIIALEFRDPEKVARFREWIKPQFEGELDVFGSSRFMLEVVPHGVNKGTGLRNLCGLLEIPVEDSVSAGDAENDEAMIRAAGTGCAMANAMPYLKEIADYVTLRDCDHSGVAEILYRFCIRNEEKHAAFMEACPVEEDLT